MSFFKKYILFLVCACTVSWCLLGAYTVNLPPKISISVAEETSVEGREIPLYITIDHMAKQSVDTKSFRLDESGLKVDVLQEEKVTPPGSEMEGDEESLVVNRYRVFLPKRQAGVYTAGPITVLVGGVRYNSNIITMNVQAAVVTNTFRLEAKVVSPPKIFPGQEVVFEYRIFFQGSLQLLREELPMLNIQGFLTTSASEVTTEGSANGYVQVIRQRAKAAVPGTYEIGVSTIEGMGFALSQGAPRLIPPLYRATAPSFVVTILPFPDGKRPSTFDGALGSFLWRVSPVGSSVTVGDSVQIEYRVSGRGDLSTVRFPSFDRLAGLTDSFWTEGSPPVGEEIEGTKRFILTVRPKRLGPVEVPGFFAVSFDQYSEQYLTTAVSPVKLMVEGSKEAEKELEKKVPVTGRVLSAPFEIDNATASVRYVSPLWICLATVIAIAVGLLEFCIVRRFRQEGEKQLTSRDLFYRAVMNRSKREKGLQLLRQAFYVQLFEAGLTPAIVDSPNEITGEGLVEEVKALLQMIDRQLYEAGGERTTLKDIYDEASSLYFRVKQLKNSK